MLFRSLSEVVIAFLLDEEDELRTQADQFKLMRRLRDQMPSMVRQRRVIFRVSKERREKYEDHSVWESLWQDIFTRGSPYWKDITLDDLQPPRV